MSSMHDSCDSSFEAGSTFLKMFDGIAAFSHLLPALLLISGLKHVRGEQWVQSRLEVAS